MVSFRINNLQTMSSLIARQLPVSTVLSIVCRQQLWVVGLGCCWAAAKNYSESTETRLWAWLSARNLRIRARRTHRRRAVGAVHPGSGGQRPQRLLDWGS